MTITGSEGSVKADNYAFVASLVNTTDVTSKPMYARVTATSTCTGDVIGLASRVQLDTGSNVGAAHCLQIGPAGDLAKVINSVIWMQHETGQGLAQYGILSDINMGYTVSMIRGVAGGGGDFLTWYSSGGAGIVFSVNDAGDIFTNTKLTVGLYTELTDGLLARTATTGDLALSAGSTGSLRLGTGTNYPLDISGSIINVGNASGKRLNFTGAGATTVGAAGGAAALPATPLGYVTMRVNNADIKIPYYNT